MRVYSAFWSWLAVACKKRPFMCLRASIVISLKVTLNSNVPVFKGLGFWCLTPHSTIFQLYSGHQFNWWSKTGENHWHAASLWKTLAHNVVSNTSRLSGIQTHNFSGDRHWLHKGNFKSNHHTIMTTSVPSLKVTFELTYM